MEIISYDTYNLIAHRVDAIWCMECLQLVREQLADGY